MKKHVFIATSLDGYIADKDNRVDWLHDIDNPHGDDCGFGAFISKMDALVMGRNTFDMVAGFEGDWPYPIPVYVCSRSLHSVPEKLADKVQLLAGTPKQICEKLSSAGVNHLYVDGGNLIQQFLQAELIDEMTVSTMPILLGAGVPLFGQLNSPIKFKHLGTQCYLGAIVSNHYARLEPDDSL